MGPPVRGWREVPPRLEPVPEPTDAGQHLRIRGPRASGREGVPPWLGNSDGPDLCHPARLANRDQHAVCLTHAHALSRTDLTANVPTQGRTMYRQTALTGAAYPGPCGHQRERMGTSGTPDNAG